LSAARHLLLQQLKRLGRPINLPPTLSSPSPSLSSTTTNTPTKAASSPACTAGLKLAVVDKGRRPGGRMATRTVAVRWPEVENVSRFGVWRVQPGSSSLSSQTNSASSPYQFRLTPLSSATTPVEPSEIRSFSFDTGAQYIASHSETFQTYIREWWVQRNLAQESTPTPDHTPKSHPGPLFVPVSHQPQQPPSSERTPPTVSEENEVSSTGMNSLAQAMAEDVLSLSRLCDTPTCTTTAEITPSQQIVSLAYDSYDGDAGSNTAATWTATTQTGMKIHSRSVIITTPVPQTIQLLQSTEFKSGMNIGGAVEKHHRAMLDSLWSVRYNPCLCLLMYFPDAPQPLSTNIEQDALSSFDIDNVHVTWIPQSLKVEGSSRGTGEGLLIQASPEWSEKHYTLPGGEVEIVRRLVEETVHAFGKSGEFERVPWLRESLLGGSTSNSGEGGSVVLVSLMKWRYANVGKGLEEKGFLDLESSTINVGDIDGSTMVKGEGHLPVLAVAGDSFMSVGAKRGVKNGVERAFLSGVGAA
ncbi:hypothetical protein HK102_008797, partial [Quaeritorhiza haematococci]